MRAEDFQRIALSLEGAQENSHMGQPDFRVGDRICCDACLGERGIRKPDAHAGAAGGIRRGTARSFSPHPGWMGTDGS